MATNEREWYNLADRAANLLRKRAVKRFEDAKDEAGISGFDELTVLAVTKTLYDRLERDNEEVFLDLAQERYEEVEPHGEEKPSLAWLLALLDGYNAITKYQYSMEWERKRDRTAEAINASTAKATEFRRGLSYWNQMTVQYADIVTDEATLKAYVDSGVRRVRWITAGDDRVCKTCRERNGKVYQIDKIPPKPHWGCRCTFEPVFN